MTKEHARLSSLAGRGRQALRDGLLSQFFVVVALAGPSAHGASFNIDAALVDHAEFTTMESVIDKLTVDYVVDLVADEDNVTTGLVVARPGGYEIKSLLIIGVKDLPEELFADLQSRLRRIFFEGAPWKGKSYQIVDGRVGFTANIEGAIEQIETIARSSTAHDLSRYDDVCEFWLFKYN